MDLPELFVFDAMPNKAWCCEFPFSHPLLPYCNVCMGQEAKKKLLAPNHVSSILH
jgi:hypothetical protein